MKPVMRVARKVLENTKHTLLVGDKATEFAISLGTLEKKIGI
jgi:isoaspartyl peptidase/L-asparaginase-like protein (Ntn-hydrolase superfamily)